MRPGANGGRLLRSGGRLDHDPAQVAQECLALKGALNQHAATVHRIDLAAGKVQFAQTIQRTGDRRFRNVQVGRQAADRMGAVLQITCQENPKLSRGQIRAVTPDEGDNGVTQDTDRLVGGLIGCHDVVLSVSRAVVHPSNG